MKSDLIINEKIFKLQKITNVDAKRGELYSIITLIILSENKNQSNKELKLFLQKLDIYFKDYVFKSKTLVLARTLRKINYAEEQEIRILQNKLLEIYDIKINKNKKVRGESEEYLNNILEKYSRGKKDE